MNNEELQKLKELAQVATPGPWTVCRHLESVEADAACTCGYRGTIYGPDDYPMSICQPGHDPDPVGEEGMGPQNYPRVTQIANAKFIAAANPAAILKLIALAEKSLAAPTAHQAREPLAWHVKHSEFRHFSGAMARACNEARVHKPDPESRYYEGCTDLVITPLYAAAQAPAPTTQAAQDVLAERRRQMEQEGWMPAHDDAYANNELRRAASAYAMHFDPFLIPHIWPWAADWWKPTTERRNLVKAGALILAEIERLDRLSTTGDAAIGEKGK